MNAILEKTATDGNEVAKMTKPKTATKNAKTAQPSKLQPVPEGTPVSTKTEVVDDNKVKTTFGFRMHKDATERYMKTTVLDYSNVSRAELLELATSSVRITIQGRLRKMGEHALDVGVLANVDVKSDVVDTEKSAVDDLTRAARSFARASNGKLSEHDARKILEAQLK